MLTLDCDILGRSLGISALIAALDRGHREGVDLVERCLLTEPVGGGRTGGQGEGAGPNHLLVWPAWRFGAYSGAKLVSVFPGNAATGAPTNTTVYLLFDGTDGRPLAVMTGDAFTTMKTSADSAVAAGYLARPDVRVLACLGAGAQAAAQIAAHRAVRPSLERVLIWNRTAAKAEALATTLRTGGLEAQTVPDPDLAVAAADVVTAVTSSREPIVRGALLRPGTHVDLVGGFTPDMREADDRAVARARVFVDTRRFTVADCGDIAGPIASGALLAEDIAGDLYELCRGEVAGRRDPDEITLFKNAGGGHLDLMTAVALYEHARDLGRP